MSPKSPLKLLSSCNLQESRLVQSLSAPLSTSSPLFVSSLSPLAPTCLFLSLWSSSVESRGGGSKRTFGSPKSQSSQSQNLADCADQSNCPADQLDQSTWRSALGATMALIGPLLVLLALIAMIKFCFSNVYPKGYHVVDQHRRLDNHNQHQHQHQNRQHHHHHRHQHPNQFYERQAISELVSVGSANKDNLVASAKPSLELNGNNKAAQLAAC